MFRCFKTPIYYIYVFCKIYLQWLYRMLFLRFLPMNPPPPPEIMLFVGALALGASPTWTHHKVIANGKRDGGVCLYLNWSGVDLSRRTKCMARYSTSGISKGFTRWHRFQTLPLSSFIVKSTRSGRASHALCANTKDASFKDQMLFISILSILHKFKIDVHLGGWLFIGNLNDMHGHFLAPCIWDVYRENKLYTYLNACWKMDQAFQFNVINASTTCTRCRSWINWAFITYESEMTLKLPGDSERYSFPNGVVDCLILAEKPSLYLMEKTS